MKNARNIVIIPRNENYTKLQMTFKKGNPGKPKGAVSRFTTLKAAFIGAFESIGGQRALEEWLNESAVIRDKNGKVLKISFGDRKRVFFQMMASMLPKEVIMQGDMNVNVNNIKGVIDYATGESRGVPTEGKKDAPSVEGKSSSIS